MSPIPCPACSRLLPESPTSCPGCHLPLTGPAAARLWQVDQSLAALQRERTALIATLRAQGVASAAGARWHHPPTTPPTLPAVPATHAPGAPAPDPVPAPPYRHRPPHLDHPADAAGGRRPAGPGGRVDRVGDRLVPHRHRGPAARDGWPHGGRHRGLAGPLAASPAQQRRGTGRRRRRAAAARRGRRTTVRAGRARLRSTDAPMPPSPACSPPSSWLPCTARTAGSPASPCSR